MDDKPTYKSKSCDTSKSKHRKIFMILLGKDFLDMIQKDNLKRKKMIN